MDKKAFTWLDNNEFQYQIWERKYRRNNESFDEWLDRISGKDEELKQLIFEKKFLLGGRSLANRGIDNTGSLFNCYSRGYVEDDYNDIMDVCKDIGVTFKAQGGQGISLSKLRPKGTPIKDEYVSDGIIPFMKIFNEVTAGTSQGGARKGALMISLDARHKEVSDFIRIKSKEGEIEKANLSLEVDDEFMEAVQKYYDTGEIVTLHEKRNYSGHEIEYDIVPIEIFKLLVDNCYDWADPACLFVNRFRNYNLMELVPSYEIETSNPCGEQPLPKNGACCLSSLNLSQFIDNPYTEKALFNEHAFIHAIGVGIRTLDKLIDENYYRHPLKAQREMSFNYRNIGLGIFGYASALMKLGLRYGSPEALEWTNFVFDTLFVYSVLASNELAKKYGPFPKYDSRIFDSEIIKRHFTLEEIEQLKLNGLRNCSLISIAPNGSLATLLGESGGCEPEFALKYTRRTVGMTDGEDTYHEVYCKSAQEYMTIHNTQTLPEYFVGSADINWKDRVMTQAIMQNHVDTAISSTVNMPQSATKDDVAQMYLLAWKTGCKGITMFRDGCKRLGILTTNPSQEKEEEKGLSRGEIISCSDNLIGMKRRLTTGCVDKDTEFFTGTGWKKISEYEDGDLVLQYNPDGTATLVKPLQYIKRPSNGQYHIKTKYGLDMMLSPDHRNVTFLKDNKYKIMTTEEIVNAHYKTDTGFARKFKLSFNYDGEGINLTDEEIRLSVAIFADGCFYSPTSNKCIISIKKKRKRDRLISILEKANIEYSERIDDDNYYNVKFYPPLAGVKTFPNDWYNCSKHQLEIIFDEVFYWDGYEKENNQYTTIIKSNADFIQFVCSALGKRGSIYKDERNKNTTYRVDWSDRKFASIQRNNNKLDIPLIQPEDGYDYCFSVPSTMLVLRRNDKIFITGNCGSLHCTAWFDPHTGDLMEIYLNKGSTGGCVDADTEYFNGTEWKKISTYKRGSQEKVLQYNLNGTAELVVPDNYIVNENISNLVHFRNHYGLDMVLSNDHRIFAYKNYQKYKMGIRKSLTYEIMTVDEYIQRGGSKERHIPTTFRMNAPGLPLNEQIIRLLVCVYADGTWNGDRIVVNVKKDRKKERIEKLLKEANIGYSRRDIYNTQYSIFSFYAPTQQKEWFVDKQFTPKWLNCSDEQAKIIIDECVYWDGSIEEGNRLGAYYSSKKQEIDILQFLLARIGYRGTISDNTSTVSKVPSYRLRWTERNVHNLEFAEISNYQTIDGKSYCFSVPSTLLVLRRNNKIFITGNCANFMVGLSRMISLACRGGVKIEDIADQLQSTGACPSYASRTATKHDTSKGACCPMAVGNALMEMWKEMKERIEKGNSIIALADSNSQISTSESRPPFNPEADNGAKCPECGSELIQEGGCVICKSCGWSRCG